MLTFESVETKSNEFNEAYSGLMDEIKDRMVGDEAFASKVRQAVSESLFALSVTRALPVNGYLKPLHAYQLGRYSTPDLYPFECHAYSVLNSAKDANNRLSAIVQAVSDTFDSLTYVAGEEEPIRWFTGFSKCSFWESFSTAILGVDDSLIAESGNATLYTDNVPGGSFSIEHVELRTEARGFAYPLLALTYLQKQFSSLEAGIIIRSANISIPGLRDVKSPVFRFFSLCQKSIDETAAMITTLMED